MQLRELLQQARPSWSEEDLDAVELRLQQVGIDSTKALADALRHQLNEKLRQANQKTFTAETVRDLRQALGVKCRQKAAPKALSPARPCEEVRPEPPEPPPAAAAPKRERPSWREVLSQVRTAQEEGGASARQAAPEAKSCAGEEGLPRESAWMQALQKAREREHFRGARREEPSARSASPDEPPEPEARGGSRAGNESSGEEVVDLPAPMSASPQALQLQPASPREQQAPTARSFQFSAMPKRPLAATGHQPQKAPLRGNATPEGAAHRGARLHQEQISGRPQPPPSASPPATSSSQPRPLASEAPQESSSAEQYEKGKRLREKLKAARAFYEQSLAKKEAAEAGAQGGGDVRVLKTEERKSCTSPRDVRENSLFQEEEEEQGSWQHLCSDCGIWPASSDPADDGSNGYCDNCWFKWEGPLLRPPVPKRNQLLIVRTAKDQGLRLSRLPPETMQPGLPLPGDLSVLLDPSVKYQTVLGFGGAFTESSAQVLKKLSPRNQERVLEAYFCEDSGLAYSFGRLHMTSCDFSQGNWTCCDKPFDVALETFSMERYHEAIFPMVRRAQDLRGGQRLKLLASPWSPPAWMKASGKMCVKGDTILPEFRGAWARYFVRFAEEMEQEGLHLWGFTVQNEPDNVDVVWETCLLSGQEERNFVTEHLAPALDAAGFAQEPRIIAWDHNRQGMLERARVLYEDPEAFDRIWGMAFHWYVEPTFQDVQYVHDIFPEKHLIFSEGCQEGGPHVGEWHLGELYGANIIQDLNHWTEAWLDWNLVLDEKGGPNHAGNFCSAPVIADTKRDSVFFQPSYYYIGHFTRHVQPGAVRISCVIQGSLNGYDDLHTVAFLNVDSTVVFIVLNMGDQTVDFALCFAGTVASVNAPEHSITTMTLLAPAAPLDQDVPPEAPLPAAEQKFCIVGTWDNWKAMHEMQFDRETPCFYFVVELSNSWESFQILVGDAWDARLYPDKVDASHHSQSRVCGPDDHGHGRNWTIGRHPLDNAVQGARYRVRLLLTPEGRVKGVDWQPQGTSERPC